MFETRCTVPLEKNTSFFPRDIHARAIELIGQLS